MPRFFNRCTPAKIAGVALAAQLLVGCSATDSVVSTPTVDPVHSVQLTQLLATQPEQLWQQEFPHHHPGLLKQVAQQIEYLAVTSADYQQLEKLSFYLRVYSSFGPDKNWQDGTAEALERALTALHHRPDFYQITANNARLHENYAVALHRLYWLEPMQPLVANHIQPLAKLIDLYANAQLPESLAFDYALWEVVRAAGILAFEARNKNKAPFISALQGNNELQSALMAFVGSNNAMRKGTDWPRQNALWGLSKWYNVHHQLYLNEYYELDEAAQKDLDDDKTRLPIQDVMAKLDNQLWQSLQSLNLADAAASYTVPYVVNSFRGKSECEEAPLKGRCKIPTLEQGLPIRKDCSDSLFILAQSMTDEQLNQSCQRLTTQTDTFHQKLATHYQPVANDFNDKLRVVVFDDQAQYNIYGQLVFDIHTDNGGMYIEGTTQNPDNQATFYAYEHFWQRPKFGVWNLNHEYVHYLDGRFVKYDTFGHFPSHLVWWSEGLAEYIAKGDDNKKSAEILHDIAADEGKQAWLTLQQVFDTEYKDGGDQVYRWGYMATRFMNERHSETYRKLAHFLKTDYFDGYKALLDKTGAEQQADFADWLETFYQSHQVAQQAKDETKPRLFYRYSYRRYLKPDYLVEDARHMHWQYWHQNANAL